MDWKADQVHCALFLLPSVQQQDALQLWQQLHGGRSPEAYQRPSTSPFAASQSSGVDGKYNVTIAASPGRVDVQCSMHQMSNNSGPPHQITNIAEAAGRVISLVGMLARTLKFNRFGLIANLSIRCETPSQLTDILREASDGVWFPNPPDDCVYQVNVRRPFKSAPELEMNRVVTLAASSLSLMDFQLANSGILNPLTTQSIPLVSAKLDLNSAPGISVLPNIVNLVDDAQTELMRFLNLGIRFLR